MIYAVIDTNVFVSAMITHHSDSATVLLYQRVLNGDIVPLYDDDILKEYQNVLSRPRFKVEMQNVEKIIAAIRKYGILSDRVLFAENMVDEADRVFYEVALSYEGSYLVTGNQKHFPKSPIVVSPAEMLEILAHEE